ncbi:MAG: hypothetical protein R3F60_18075 [bacterium]
MDAGTPWPPAVLPVTLTDLAGNRIDIDIPRFSLEILPPPLIIQAGGADAPSSSSTTSSP